MEIDLSKEALDDYLKEHNISDVNYFMVSERSTVSLICSLRECFERRIKETPNFGRLYGRPVYLVDNVEERRLMIVEVEKEIKVKQVIVMRKDLKMRRGKEIAQGGHAVMKAVMDLMSKEVLRCYSEDYASWSLKMKTDDPIYLWLNGIFTKIAVTCKSEDELMEIYNKAKDSGIICSLIKDAGKTEFGGVPTYTCCAIGPGWAEEVDKITGHLPLY